MPCDLIGHAMLLVRFRRERFTAGASGWKGDKSVLVLEDGQLLSSFLLAMVKKRTGNFCTVFIGAQEHKCEWLSRLGLTLLS